MMGRPLRNTLLVANTVWIEALRRREIYVIILLTVTLLIAAASIRFFDLKSVHKLYQELPLKTMSLATALTVIVLGARQLPREFERRTIYTLLAKPVSRGGFLLGKYLGVVAAGWITLGLFMLVFLAGRALNPMPLDGALFAQYLYLQALLVMVLAALSFLLSLLLAVDAAITVTTLLYLLGHQLTNAFTELYEFVGGLGRLLLRILNYAIPQPALFDLSGKLVHNWPPVAGNILLLVTLYALAFVFAYLALGYCLFRRRAL